MESSVEGSMIAMVILNNQIEIEYEIVNAKDVAVFNRSPADLNLQRVRQHAQNLPVHVVDGGGKEQQRAHRPAEVRTRRHGNGR